MRGTISPLTLTSGAGGGGGHEEGVSERRVLLGPGRGMPRWFKKRCYKKGDRSRQACEGGERPLGEVEIWGGGNGSERSR